MSNDTIKTNSRRCGSHEKGLAHVGDAQPAPALRGAWSSAAEPEGERSDGDGASFLNAMTIVLPPAGQTLVGVDVTITAFPVHAGAPFYGVSRS